MILVVTNKNDLHADVVIQRLIAKGRRVFRLNTEDFLTDTVFAYASESGRMTYDLRQYGKVVSDKDIRSVWYRKPVTPEPTDYGPGPHGDFVVAETMEALHGFLSVLDRQRWLNPFWALPRASNKIRQLLLAERLGLLTPRTCVTNDGTIAARFAGTCERTVYKTLFAPVLDYEDGSSTVIHTHELAPEDIESLADDLDHPGCFQEYVPKRVEIRATVVDGEVFAAEIHSQSSDATKIDWRKEEGYYGIPYAIHELPESIKEKLIAFLEADGLTYGAFDLILVGDGRYIFLENNPNGEWLWIQIRTGLKICEAIANYLAK